jgi:hypothetical protein
LFLSVSSVFSSFRFCWASHIMAKSLHITGDLLKTGRNNPRRTCLARMQGEKKSQKLLGANQVSVMRRCHGR